MTKYPKKFFGLGLVCLCVLLVSFIVEAADAYLFTHDFEPNELLEQALIGSNVFIWGSVLAGLTSKLFIAVRSRREDKSTVHWYKPHPRRHRYYPCNHRREMRHLGRKRTGICRN